MINKIEKGKTMQRYKNITLFVLVILCVYFLFSQFYLKTLGNTYTYIINPIFYGALALILKFIITSPYKNDKYKRNMIQYVSITILSYTVLYLLSGLFLTYGANPYARSFLGLLLNCYSIGIIIVLREYIRYKLINSVLKKEQKLIFILIVAVFTLEQMDFNALITSINIYYLFKIIFSIVIPTAIKNTLFTYMASYTDFVPAIIYDIGTNLVFWIPPILPKTPWIFDSITSSVFPLILFLYCRYEVSIKDKLHLYKFTNPIEPRGTIPLVAGVILIIWFTLGIFPIKPIGVASGSMEPTINVGDVVIVKKCGSNDIEINDIIEYTRKDYSVIHRVIDKYQKDGTFYFITKGDNNNGADSDPVSEEMLKGKVIARIPYIALPTIWLDRLSGRQANVEVETGN